MNRLCFTFNISLCDFTLCDFTVIITKGYLQMTVIVRSSFVSCELFMQLYDTSFNIQLLYLNNNYNSQDSFHAVSLQSLKATNWWIITKISKSRNNLLPHFLTLLHCQRKFQKLSDKHERTISPTLNVRTYQSNEKI